MKTIFTFAVFTAGLIFLCDTAASQKYVAGHEVAREDVLRSIPVVYINGYQHTSHGTHVSRGVFGLQADKQENVQDEKWDLLCVSR